MLHHLKNILKILPAVLLVFLFSTLSNAQENLPDKIRGYKVYKASVSVKTYDQKPENPENDKDTKEAFVLINEPELSSVGLTGIIFNLTAEFETLDQSGKVDFMTFKDFRVNGIAVDIEEYKESFKFKKKKKVELPKPFEIFVSTPQTLFGAVRELGNSKEKWRVTGRVFVFGKFRKAGFKFKRVVPVDIDIEIDNPILKQN